MSKVKYSLYYDGKETVFSKGNNKNIMLVYKPPLNLTFQSEIEMMHIDNARKYYNELLSKGWENNK